MLFLPKITYGEGGGWGAPPVRSVGDLFAEWINIFTAGIKKFVLIGVSSILRTIWRLKNSAIFDNQRINDPCVPVYMMAN